MNETKVKYDKREKMLVDTLGLQEVLSSGRPVAVEIGTKAGQRYKLEDAFS